MHGLKWPLICCSDGVYQRHLPARAARGGSARASLRPPAARGAATGSGFPPHHLRPVACCFLAISFMMRSRARVLPFVSAISRAAHTHMDAHTWVVGLELPEVRRSRARGGGAGGGQVGECFHHKQRLPHCLCHTVPKCPSFFLRGRR